MSGYGIVDDSGFVSSTAASPTAVASTITPTLANSLNLILTLAGDNVSAGSTVSFSNPAIATNNPTWTERLDSGISNGSARYGIAVYTAPRTEATAWGNITLTYVQNANAEIGAVILNIAPRVDGTHSVVTAPVYAVKQPFLRTGAISLTGTNPGTNSLNKTSWTNPDKPTTTWINPNK